MIGIKFSTDSIFKQKIRHAKRVSRAIKKVRLKKYSYYKYREPCFIYNSRMSNQVVHREVCYVFILMKI